jgi:hypothetical protein
VSPVAPEHRHLLPLHPSVRGILRWFDHTHLPGDLQAVARPIGDLAWEFAERLPAADPELKTGLRKLLEAKDCLVRAAIAARTETTP